MASVDKSKREFLGLSILGIEALAIGLPLSGCSGGNSTSGSTTQTGYFVDVPVQGLAYSSKSCSGMTGPSGSFNYVPGEQISFNVGNVIVGSISNVPNDRLITVNDLAGLPRDSWWDIQSIVIAQFLQSLHSDIQTQSFITPKFILDAGGNSTVEFEGLTINITQNIHDNLMSIPVTYLYDPRDGTHISQTKLASLVKTATSGRKQLVSCIAAVTSQMFYPT